MKLAVADLGGTHSRFAVARIESGRPVALEHVAVLKTAEFPDLKSAWSQFAAGLGSETPRDAAVAVACPADGPVLKLTNADWVIRTDRLADELGLDRVQIINDFVAVAHAVTGAPPHQMVHICGPDAMPPDGVISVVGPGTGLGVAQILRMGGATHVVPTEGGHIGFAPNDSVDDAILAHLRGRFVRVSVERAASGPGLLDIYEVLAKTRSIEPRTIVSDALWALALSGTDELARDALQRYCAILGSVVGDIALAQGANALVIAGGVGLKLAGTLPASGFRAGMTGKGRFRQRLESLPVKLFTESQPGLIGAAIAYTVQQAGSHTV
jgi:glucokinase